MEIRQLRSFIAVADTLNFSRAADSVFLSQSALSRQITDLEKELGVLLFNRSTRRVELTPAGVFLRQHAKELINNWERLIPELRSQAGPTEQAITLTLGLDIRALSDPKTRLAAADAFYDFRQKHPGSRILFRHQDYSSLVQGLLDGSLDAALILDREIDHRAEIMSIPLRKEEMVLVFRSRNEHRNLSEIILRRGLILIDREPQGIHHIVRILTDLHIEPQIRFCSGFDDMTLSVESGESAAILPQSVAAKLSNPHLQCLSIPSAQAALTLSLLYCADGRGGFLPELTELLRQTLGEPDKQKETVKCPVF